MLMTSPTTDRPGPADRRVHAGAIARVHAFH
jgi:hypothetical protein